MRTPGFYWWWDDQGATPKWRIVEVVPFADGQEARGTNGEAFRNFEGRDLRGPLLPPAPPRDTFWDRLLAWWRSRQ